MCGRFENMLSKEQLMEYFKAKFAIDVVDFTGGRSVKQKNICPTDDILVVTHSDDQYKIEVMKWGFTLTYGPMFNSRIEEIMSGKTSNYWQPLVSNNPCLIPMTSYYEWKDMNETIEVISPKTGKKSKKKVKQPYTFKTDEEVIFTAGYFRTEKIMLRSEADENEKSALIKCCTMITTTGNEVTRPVHPKDRMPVILSKKLPVEYLNADLETRFNLSRSYASDLMTAVPCEL